MANFAQPVLVSLGRMGYCIACRPHLGMTRRWPQNSWHSQCSVARQYLKLPMTSHYQVIWERGRLSTVSCRDFIGLHCIVMLLSIAAHVRCARRLHAARQGEYICHPCQWLKNHSAELQWTSWDYYPKAVLEGGMCLSYVIMLHGTPRLWH